MHNPEMVGSGETLAGYSEAIRFATEAHAGQTRKGSDSPYIKHPLEVADIVKTMTDNEEVWTAAVLHDTVEDTDTSIDDIRNIFGERVASLVLSDTEDKREELPPEETWLIRKQETINHLNNTEDLEEKMIVLADKLSNMRQLVKDYSQIGDQVWQRFHQKNKEMHAWYYKSILESTKELDSYNAWQEYKDLVEKVFD